MADVGGRLLLSIDLQNEIEAGKQAVILEDAANEYLSRLYATEADRPIRYDPPEHIRRRHVSPKYFFGGAVKRASRVVWKGGRYPRFCTI